MYVIFYKIVFYCFCPKMIHKEVMKQKLVCCTKIAKVTPQVQTLITRLFVKLVKDLIKENCRKFYGLQVCSAMFLV